MEAFEGKQVQVLTRFYC